MARKLLNGASPGPISPLIDVVMNGMAAMFILLMVYLSVARPDQNTPESLRFLEVAPGPALAEGNYTFSFPVAGSQILTKISAPATVARFRPSGLNATEYTGLA